MTAASHQVAAQVQEKFEQGLALHQQGQLAQAQELYQQVLQLQPQHCDALHLLGLCAMQANKYEEAADLMGQALAVHPYYAQIYYNRGLALQGLQQFDAAVASYDRAIALNPNYTHAYSNRGNALQELEQFDTAVASYDRALALEPDCATVYYNRGNALKALQQFDAAVASYSKAIALDPSYAQAYSNRGIALKELWQVDAAIASYDQAISLDPGYAQAYYNRGIAFLELKQLDAALTSYDQAIALKPDYVQAYINRGNALQALKQFDAAVHSYDQAIALDPGQVDAYWNKALCLLLTTKYSVGWALYEWRWKTKKLIGAARQFPWPQWLGTDAHHKNQRLLIWGEQGLGDQILFLSMLQDVAKRVEQITVAVEPRLIQLVQRSFPQVKVIALEKELDKTLGQGPKNQFDSQTSMGELGKFVRKNAEDFPTSGRPYLIADPLRRAQLREKITNHKPRVCGISWLSKDVERGHAKSMCLRELKAVVGLEHFQWIDLQYGDTHAERMALQQEAAIEVRHVDEIDNFQDIDGLAALIDACDVVVTVSNTTAHIAGALGKLVYLMLPYANGLLWYWHEGLDNSPWYPTVKLYRQQSPGDWAGVIERVATDLSQSLIVSERLLVN